MLKRPFESVRRARERGVALYITAASLLVLMPIVGLSIDGGFAFVIRTRLSAAMDSAALAAGRGINLAGTVQQAQAQATTQATNFFNANFPAGYMNTDATAANRTLTPVFTVNVDANNHPTGTLTIKLTGSVLAPTYFMKWLGFNNVPVSASGTATRRNLVMELVLDRSASMGTRNTATGTIPASITATSTSCEAMVYSSIQFLQYFSPYDNIGEISFDYTVHDDYAASTNYWKSGAAGMSNSIANINCGNNTNTTAALWEAYQDIKVANQPLAQNVIVLFTDGVPNGVNATFPVRTHVDDRLGTAPSPAAPNNPSGNTTNCTTSDTTTCYNMPVCTTTAATVTGVITQISGFNVNSGARDGPFKMLSTDATPTVPAACPQSGTSFTSQTVAYIPDTDYFGNSMHGPPNPSNGNSTLLWDGWLYQVNSHTAPNGTPITNGNSATKNLGDYWSNYSSTGAGAPSNFFPASCQAGACYYSGKFRPDLSNTIGVASMNSATNEAAAIRADTAYNIAIDAVYLQGNAGDPVDRAFLQIVTNQQNIVPIIYDNNASTYANPYYNSSQQPGMWMATTSTLQLQALFQQIASSLLRISQ